MKGKIFNNEEVQAIIAGMKTMFREVVKPQPVYRENCFFYRDSGYSVGWYNLFLEKILQDNTYKIGQEIFVKESFSKLLIHSGHQYYYPAHCIRECVDRDNGFHYWADGNPEFGDWESPRPATNMKQEHSRLTLRIKSVKVERLQDINEKEAFKSGYFTIPNREAGESYVSKFIQLWNSTQKKQEHKWEANPWVFVYEFEIINLKK